jgi:hypothetical protein
MTSACSLNVQQELAFDIVSEHIAFPIEIEDRDQIPKLIVIPELAKISQLEFSDALLAHVSEIDFQKSLIILFIRGQLPESGTVKEIVRDKYAIIIRTTEFDPGPGSYVLPGFTPPYQIIKVTKTGAWNGNFNFILERENGEIVSRVTEYVP